MDGLCLPQGNQVLLGPVRINFLGRIVYPEQDGTTTVESSRGLGSGPGQMSLPLSMAGGADGRVYVLDAGNSRIEVFDVAGNYITQWGVPGTGAGEFDFGSGVVGGGRLHWQRRCGRRGQHLRRRSSRARSNPGVFTISAVSLASRLPAAYRSCGSTGRVVF